MSHEGDLERPRPGDWTRTLDWSAQKKRAISIRLDEDVLAFFKRAGPGYQKRINAVLRSYKAAHER